MLTTFGCPGTPGPEQFLPPRHKTNTCRNKFLGNYFCANTCGACIGTRANTVRGPRMGRWIRRGWIWHFWGAPISQSRSVKMLVLKGFRTSGRKIGPKTPSPTTTDPTPHSRPSDTGKYFPEIIFCILGKFLRDFISVRMQVALVFAPARLEDKFPGELFVHWFRARG